MPFLPEDVDIQKELDLAEKAAAATPPETPPEPPPEAAPETPPAPPAELVEAEPAKPSVTKVVPLAALHEARNEAKELKEQLRRKSEEDAARYAALQQRLDQLQNPPPEKPTFEVDPANFLKDKVDTIEKTQAREEQEKNLARLENEVSARLQNSEAAYAKDHADYNDAAKYLGDVIVKNLKTLGITDPVKHTAAFKQEVLKLTISALQTGREPAELVYEMAKNQGFTAPAKKDTGKIENIVKGQEAAKTLGSGGRVDTGALTLDTLARMDDDEYTALVADEKKWKQLEKLMH